MKIIIVGGGLVGSLSTVFFGQKGHQVDVYEYREDPRKMDVPAGRSINLALSARGRAALRAVGLEASVLAGAVPMYGRMIHTLNGQTFPIPYDPVHKNCIYSVGRKRLNEVLLDEAANLPNVKLHFEKKVVKIKPSSGEVILERRDRGIEETTGDLIVGADGAYSTVRRDLMKADPVNFSQTYIDHGYIELSIPAHNNHKMIPNHLHIWPRGQFMMIALPNQDESWTVTLFMPLSNFASLRGSLEVRKFFRKHFSDAVQLIGTRNLVETFMFCQPSHLMSVKCSKYHSGSKLVIIGDAAHAMVPFFGQGMNAGFEDCAILNELLHNHDYTVEHALEEFSRKRNPDAEAICDLAMYNYIEMRDLVNKRLFRFRKLADNILYRCFGSVWVPLYQSVTFTDISYRKCLENKTWQDSVMRMVFTVIYAIAVIIFITILYFTDFWRVDFFRLPGGQL